MPGPSDLGSASSAARKPYADAALALLLLLIIALMIIPIPTQLLDLLIASNLALAVVLLLVSMAIPDGLAFTAMPTVLLVTTLYRLALNVSTVRLILVQADAGALPHLGVGAALAPSLRLRHLWVVVEGAVFATQEAHVSADAGGEFRLAFGAALVCLPYELARLTISGCAGFELGRLSGQGVGVGRPRLGSATWEAPRAEVGAAIPVGARLALVIRGGAAVPLSTPEFVIDGTTPVHRSSAVAARAGLGVELGF